MGQVNNNHSVSRQNDLLVGIRPTARAPRERAHEADVLEPASERPVARVSGASAFGPSGRVAEDVALFAPSIGGREATAGVLSAAGGGGYAPRRKLDGLARDADLTLVQMEPELDAAFQRLAETSRRHGEIVQNLLPALQENLAEHEAISARVDNVVKESIRAIRSREAGAPTNRVHQYITEVAEPARRALTSRFAVACADARRALGEPPANDQAAMAPVEKTHTAMMAPLTGFAQACKASLELMNPQAKSRFEQAMAIVEQSMKVQQQKLDQDLKSLEIWPQHTHQSHRRRSIESRIKQRQDNVAKAAAELDKYKTEAEVVFDQLKKDHSEANELRNYRLNIHARVEQQRLVNARIAANNKKVGDIFTAVTNTFKPLRS